jgi:hypothetical protein
MTSDNRERSFEKALSRNFPSAPNARAAASVCPDPEILAAYYENSLAPQELLSWKQHFAACSRCQELLAQLAVTDNLAVEPLEMERPAILQAAPPSAVQESRKSILHLPWAAYWRWAVPAGAVAAGLLLWITIHKSDAPIQVAKNEPLTSVPAKQEEEFRAHGERPAAPKFEAADAVAPSEQLTDEPQSRQRSEPNTKSKGATEKKTTVNSGANKTTDARRGAAADQGATSARGAAESNPAVALASGNVLSRSDSAAGLNHAPSAPSVAAPAPLKPEAMTESVEVPAAAPRVPAPDAKVMARPVGRSGAEQKSRIAVVPALSDRAALRTASAKAPAVIATPESAILWRPGAAGLIERSTDAGKSWAPQPSGVIADLLAGSAPSAQVCWIVGRAGTILLTTDAGTHWVKFQPPIADDLAAVRATDARQAVVLDVTRRHAYKTIDGGLTWTQLADPQ